jgi:hypothetical protein
MPPTPNSLSLNDLQYAFYPIQATDSKTFTGSNTTVAVPIFNLVGSIEVYRIWGVVTTQIGTNHTAAYLRLNDQTAQQAITLATGTTLSAKKAGSLIVKKGLATAAVTLIDNATGVITEPTTLETMFFSPFQATQKTGATTNIEYVYTTTDTPTTGAIQFFIQYRLLAPGSVVTPL